jgi:hypothetical protein
MIKILPIASLRSMSVDEQDKLVRQVANVEVKAKNAVEAHKLSFPAGGKVAAALQERLTALLADGKIASTMTLAGYWESITRVNGGKGQKLNNHVYSCAVAFGTYVRSELIEESDYDKNTAQCLELAASISTAVGGEVSHAAVMAAAEELRDRSKNSAKNLQDLLDSVKEPKAMTAEQAQKALNKILGGGHLNLVIAGVGAEIAHLEDSETARSAFFGMITANDMFAANMKEENTLGADGKPATVQVRRFPDEVLNAWAGAYEKANAVKPESTETPDEETELEEQAA